MTAAARTTAGNVLALGELKHTHTPKMRERNVGAMVLPAMIIAVWLWGAWSGGLSMTAAILLGVGGVGLIGLTALIALNPPPRIDVHEHGLMITQRRQATALLWSEIAGASAMPIGKAGAELIGIEAHNGFRIGVGSTHYDDAQELVAAIEAHVAIARRPRKS